MWHSENPLTGRHVLLMMLGFFGIILAANGAFLYFAVTSFSGIDTENAYVKGLAYNRTLEAAEAQRALGWTLALDQARLSDGRQALSLSIRSRAGAALDGLNVVGEMRRPARQDLDRRVVFTPVGEGRYDAEVALPLTGRWDLSLRASARDGAVFVMEQRLWLK
jgi:nitrogen fixation protein FixH